MGKLLKLRKQKEPRYGFPYQVQLVDNSKVVYRYTPAMQKALNSSYKSEPWLHVLFLQAYKYNSDFNESFDDGIIAIIFVWDTRKVIGVTMVDYGFTERQYEQILSVAEYAKDNGEQLVGVPEKVGHGEYANYIGDRVKRLFSKLYS
jgi:hypothetical protein